MAGRPLGQTLVRHYGDELFFSSIDFQQWEGNGENEPLLLSNQELICTLFFNKTFPVKFCWSTKMIGSEITMSFFPGDKGSFC